MKWASAIANARRLDDAVEQAAEDLLPELDNAAPDLVFAFVTGHHAAHFERVPALVQDHLPGATLIGCSAGGVAGDGREVENQPAVALVGASLPGVRITPFRVPTDLGEHSALWEIDDQEPTAIVLLPEPFSSNIVGLLERLEATLPGHPVVGGLASGGNQPGTTALFLEERVVRTGTVGVALQGAIRMETVVAQGCRPIGDPLFVTRGQDHLIFELDGRKATDIVEEMYRACSPSEQALFGFGLSLGVVAREGKEIYEQGDFLIRQVIGMDTDAGAVGVATTVEPHQVVQFHLRDAKASREDLDRMLERFAGVPESAAASGALMFSCLGRGKELYGEADHDSRLFQGRFPQVGMGGFFCNGEIGPVEGRIHMHSFTSAFGFFRPPLESEGA